MAAEQGRATLQQLVVPTAPGGLSPNGESLLERHQASVVEDAMHDERLAAGAVLREDEGPGALGLLLPVALDQRWRYRLVKL